MSTLILSSAAAGIGNALLGPVGGFIGSQIGAYAGTQIDNNILNLGNSQISSGFRLDDLSVQTSTYGKMIPIIYGNVRIAGNIIWSESIREIETRDITRSGNRKGGPQTELTSLSYMYTITLAISICEGVINGIDSIWADSKLLNLNDLNYRLYYGTEDQEVDPLISAIEGNAPAYRGLAYLVIENFPLTSYGNRIPNFTFEVKRIINRTNNELSTEEKIQGINIIPGSGEFVYDTNIQIKIPGIYEDENFIRTGMASRINQNSNTNISDAVLSLNNMQETLPNLGWVSVVVNWFTDSLDLSVASVFPAVEYQGDAKNEPDEWLVNEITRSEARLVSRDANNRPNYGGTISDTSLLRYLTELRSRGYRIMLNPILLVDTPEKPWRGLISGSPGNMNDFFQNDDGYNSFIKHYANLCANYVDAMLIGSEFEGITSISTTESGGNIYPGVQSLEHLAIIAKSSLGSVLVSYGANWSEYHSKNGIYHMDSLWSSTNIDFIGISAYFPITDEPQPIRGFSKEQIIEGWTSGEGYDYYYTDPDNRTGKRTFSLARDAWKNIAHWWENAHLQSNGIPTAWIPESKPIWFTEFGFPSVNACTNQPNVFVDNTASLSEYPHYSNRTIDILAQRIAIDATLDKWANSNMVERSFLWAWDARPYPYFPNLSNVWSDGSNWPTGHWIQGKLGLSNVAAIISDLTNRVGLNSEDINVTNLNDILYGYTITNQSAVRSYLESLRSAYFFDIVESGCQLKFLPRGNNTTISIDEGELINNTSNRQALIIRRIQDTELPKRVNVRYINQNLNYSLSTIYSTRNISNSSNNITINLPIVMDDNYAKKIADISLFNAWQSRNTYRFILPNKYSDLEPSDIVTLNVDNITHTIRITKVQHGNDITIDGTSENLSIYDTSSTNFNTTNFTESVVFPGSTEINILDLPLIPNTNDNNVIHIAVNGVEENWRGANIYVSMDNGDNYELLTRINTAATIGQSTSILNDAHTHIIDKKNYVDIILLNGELENITELHLLNGGNLAKLGDEIIQFQNVDLIDDNIYRLSNLIRGKLNTEDKLDTHQIGERFILLNDALTPIPQPPSNIGRTFLYKAVSVEQDPIEVEPVEFTYMATSLRIWALTQVLATKLLNNDILISWIDRTRKDEVWRDYVDYIPDNELDHYTIQILSNDLSNVLRTIELQPANENNFIYTIVMQKKDFFEAVPSINVRVIGRSKTLGI